MAIERFACLKEIKYNNHIHKHLPENPEKSVIVFIKSLAQAKSHFAPAKIQPLRRSAPAPLAQGSLAGNNDCYQ